MQRDTPADDEPRADAHSNRRRFLKGVGAATVGAVAVTGTASAQQYQFEGCRAVYGDTHADIAVVATDDGFDCRPITEAVDSEDVPWDWEGYRYEAEDGEAILGAIEEDAWQGRDVFAQWTCQLELNPSACADEYYESEYEIKSALNGNEDCGACAGLIVSGDGQGVTSVGESDDPADAGDEEGSDDDGGDASGDDDSASDDADDGAGGDDAAAGTGTNGEGETDEVEAATSIAGALRSYVNTQFGL